MTDEQFAETMRMVDAEQARAAALVRATLGLGPQEREAQTNPARLRSSSPQSSSLISNGVPPGTGFKSGVSSP